MQLQKVFDRYAGNQPTMDGAGFAKLMRDVSLIDAKLPASEVDLAFMKVKSVSGRRVSYMQVGA
eukprot:134328-Rhodomonas_salina.1